MINVNPGRIAGINEYYPGAKLRGILNEQSRSRAARYHQIGPLTLGPFPPEEGKGRKDYYVPGFPAPYGGRMSRSDRKGAV